MLMLKFGRLVDLEKLETVTVNRTVEELKEKLRQQESKSAAEMAKWNVSFCRTWNIFAIVQKIITYEDKVNFTHVACVNVSRQTFASMLSNLFDDVHIC